MDTNTYEARGRLLAQAYFEELEKIAFFERAVLEKAAPGALSDAWQYAAHHPQGAAFGWRRFLPGSATRAAYTAEAGRASALKAQVKAELAKRESGALSTLARPDASAEELEAARGHLASVRGVKLAREPMAPALADVQRSLNGGPTVSNQDASRKFRRNLAMGGTAVAALGGSAYAYNKLNQPPAADYAGY